jgi:solute:Na+ symporter, SSS family
MLAPIDWIIIISFLLLSLGIGIYYRQAAGKSLSDFFLGGRNLPWYVAGLSMVATTFAADTPLAVSELVSQGGIAKNWLWWSFLIGGALTTFFFASLWRRSGVLTELEFITLRYEGKAAHLLRSVKAVYLGLIINAVIIAWVNLAMMTLLQVFFDLGRVDAILCTFGLMILAVIYSSLSGLKGVAITDTVQFAIAMIGCVILAVIVVNSDEVGGMAKLKTTLPSQTFDFLPSVNDGGSGIIQGFSLSIGAFLSFVAIQWWASWYPGAEPGGGGYVAQRMMSTRNETESVWATLLFQVGHYCIRPWPWIVVGLCAIALYSPEITNPLLNTQLLEASTAEAAATNYAGSAADFIEMNEVSDAASIKSVEYFYSPRLGFVYAMKDFLPAGLVGLLLTAFMAAYLSTISTQVNWGASYLVNDLLLPNYPKLKNRNVVDLSRLVSVVVMIAGAAVTPMVTSISGVWAFIMQCGAGLGLVLILRWYWWRVNAWSELTATIVPLFAYGISFFYLNDLLGQSYIDNNGPFFFTVSVTTISWLGVTLISGPQSIESLKSFFIKVRPMGSWPIEFTANTRHNAGLKYAFGGWISMVAFIVFTLFCIGNFILLNTSLAMYQSIGAIISIFALRYFLKKTNIFDRNSQLHESI